MKFFKHLCLQKLLNNSAMNSKKLLFVITFILFSFNLFSQVGGISASKLVVINAETVPANKIEFEPSFGFNVSKNDSLNMSSDFGFRFTYGLNSKTEIGIFIPLHLSSVNWGIKYQTFNFNKLSLGMIAGIENALIVNNSKEGKISSLFTSYAGGIISTYQFNNKLSIDFSGQFQNHFEADKIDFNSFLNSEIGYFVSDGLQLVTGLQYENHHILNTRENYFTINSGITVEKAKNFILVVNIPYQFKNKYTSQTIGFLMALTILID